MLWRHCGGNLFSRYGMKSCGVDSQTRQHHLLPSCFSVGCVPRLCCWFMFIVCVGWSSHFATDVFFFFFCFYEGHLRSARTMLRPRSPTDPSYMSACPLSWALWPGTHASLIDLLALYSLYMNGIAQQCIFCVF